MNEKRAWAVGGGLMLLALAARLYDIDKLPFWYDEIITHYRATMRPVADLWFASGSSEHHPALYYTLLHAWSLFSDNEATLRSLSALFGVATVGLVFLMGLQLGGLTLAAVAGLITALAPLHLQYGQEARSYATLAFFISLATYAALWLIRNPALATLPLWRRDLTLSDNATAAQTRGRLLHWVLLVVGSGVTLLLHNMGIFYVTALGIALSYWVFIDQRFPPSLFRNLLLVFLAILVIWSPNLTALLRAIDAVGADFWRPVLSIFSIANVPRAIVSLQYTGYVAPADYLKSVSVWIDAGVFLAAILGFIALYRRMGMAVAVLLAAIVFLPGAGMVVASLVFKPVLLARMLIGSSVIAYILIAAGILALPRPTWRYALLAAVTLVLAVGFINYNEGHHKERWDKLTRHVLTHYQPGDIVLFARPTNRLAFEYYSRGSATAMESAILRHEPLANDWPAWPDRLGAEAFIERLNRGGRFWLVARDSLAGDDKDGYGAVLQAHKKRVAHEQWGNLHVELYR